MLASSMFTVSNYTGDTFYPQIQMFNRLFIELGSSYATQGMFFNVYRERRSYPGSGQLKLKFW